MATAYPTTLDTTLGAGPLSANRGTTATNDGTFPHGGAHADLNSAVVALETKVGVDASAVAATLEYRIRKFPWKIWTANDGNPPATLYAVWGTRNQIPFLAFDTATSWSTVFIGVVPYGAILTSGVIVRIKWMSPAVSGLKVCWGAAFERMNTDEDSDSFDTELVDTTGVASSSTSGIMVESALTCTAIDSMVAGDAFRLKIARKVAEGNDTMASDAQIVTVTIESAV